jgi:anti-sigma factor RsiW
MMTCGRARRLLWPDGGPREATAEIVAAREHASRCPLCQRFLQDMRRLSDRIHEAMPRPEAPVEVRDRLFKAIARARTDGTAGDTIRRHRRWVAGLAAALLAGGTWLGLSLVPERVIPSPDPLGAIVEDHLRSQRNAGLASSDSLEVARWLADRLPFAVEIPIFPDAQLKGARLLLVNRQSGAVVDYVIAGRSLSYYVLPAIEGEVSTATREIRVASRAGYRIAAWEDGGLTHALVAGLPGPKLVELAHYCITQMTAAVAV